MVKTLNFLINLELANSKFIHIDNHLSQSNMYFTYVESLNCDINHVINDHDASSNKYNKVTGE